MKNKTHGLLLVISLSIMSFTHCAGATEPQEGSQHAPNRSFIVGGAPVDESDPIAATTVFVSGSSAEGDYFCSGSLIANDIVVTAAHCVDGATLDSLRVIFTRHVGFNADGTVAVSDSSPEVHAIYGATFNPAYDPTATGSDLHDIALIRFQGLLPQNYHPSPLLDAGQALSAGESVTLAGYGSTDAQGNSEGGQLERVDVTVASMLGQTEVILDQSEGKGACFGDSGGPAFVKSGDDLVLWGLTNRAYPDNVQDCAHESVYTKIDSYLDWIGQTETALRGSV